MAKIILILAFASCIHLSRCDSVFTSQTVLKQEPQGYFNWSSLTSSKSLKWHKCYERQECACLEVPMDPKDSSLNETVNLAVIRDPVNISRSDPSYGGSIFLNPGGPGGSGVDFLRWAGYETHYKIEGPKHFDLVSWDPRGVGHTKPEPFCFDSELDRQLYWLNMNAVGLVDESDYALHYNLQAAKAFGQACNSTIMRYMTTLATVQDLVAISDALVEGSKDPLINFWGISYGTFIGNTLASTYPHRIGKIILDAVVSADGASDWKQSLTDTNKALDHFYETCHTVGPAKCPLFEKSASSIRDKVNKLINSLPIPVANSVSPHRSATLLTTSILKTQILSHLYKPHVDFSFLAQLLHDLTQSPPNTTLIEPLTNTLQDPHSPPEASIILPTNNSWDNPFPTGSSKWGLDTERIIACTDANSLYNWTLADYTSWLSDLQSLSATFAGIWATTLTTCTGWPVSKRAPEHVRFNGPYGSKLSDYNIDAGARPIIFIGNEGDPVCPQINAQQESMKHEGAVLLKTNIFGHAAVPVNPSKCVWEVERRYWNFGELPEDGTVCEGDWDDEKWELKA